MLLRIISPLFALMLTAFCATADSSAKNSVKNEDKYLMYVGTYTQEGSSSKGIYAYRYDPSSAQLTPIGLAAQTINPSFLAVHPNHHFLYAVNEVGNYKGQKSGAVSAFAIDHASGKLTLLNQVASGGADPCYITVDKTGKFVLVANYTGGSISVFPIRQDGSLGEASAFVQHTGHGTNPQRQEGPHAHSIDLSPDNRFAIVDDLGLDETLVYKFDSVKGSLTPNDPAFAKADPGAGPRHFALHPNGKFAYVINEMGDTVSVFSFEPANGVMHSVQTISTIPKGFTKQNDDAEIAIHPSGKFLYASNRGHDSIAVFAVDPDKGTLKLVEYASTKGQSPRHFEIDPTGSFLFAENEKSDNIVVFHIDTGTGRLKPTGKTLEVGQPVCVKFVPVE
ncbi:MAG TPA: lactonase family protein [Candidatus Sulfotelmatobacter sp.]|nr:lactonase family protein [Candidatus Sulfotelmatobacter sp.]